MYIGTDTATYRPFASKGVYLYKFHSANGKVEAAGIAAERLPQMFAPVRSRLPGSAWLLRGVQNPTFLVIHPNGRYLYTSDENRVGTVSAYRIDPATGKLSFLNTKASAGGFPCFITIDHTGRNLLVANFSGTVAVLPIAPDGSVRNVSCVMAYHGVGPDHSIQPLTHSVNLSPDNRFAIVTDIALDEILIYRFDANKGTLTPHDPPFLKTPRATGPRHFVFHPNGAFGYAVGEGGSSIVAMRWDAQRGVFTLLQTISTLPRDFHGASAGSEIVVDTSGRFLYASNRGHDSIAVFSIDPAKGTLSPLEYEPTQGKRPRNFRIDPTGRYLFAGNTLENNVVQFQIDPQSGRLTPTGFSFSVPYPNCILFSPARQAGPALPQNGKPRLDARL
jgi:6-phosphogluconolactonase